jgi:mannosyltransferase OCH1-like enzyme
MPLICIASWIGNQLLFQRFLKTLYIRPDDFDAEYFKALIAAASLKKPIEFDNYPSLASLNSTANIPARIHFIWFRDLYNAHLDISAIPHDGSNTPALCRKYNPDFDIHVWNATEARTLLEEQYPWFLPTYDGYKHPIQRVDAFKYFVLWHYGGVYMDLDVSCRRSLIPLLQYPAWFPEASPTGVNNDLMAARVRHPIIGKMTRTLMLRDKNLLLPYLTIFWKTGPRFTSDVLRMWWNEYTGAHYYRKGTSKKDNGE